MSIAAGAQVAIILLACGPCMAILNCLRQVLYLGRALRTKETLPYLSKDTPVLGASQSSEVNCTSFIPKRNQRN